MRDGRAQREQGEGAGSVTSRDTEIEIRDNSGSLIVGGTRWSSKVERGRVIAKKTEKSDK